MVELDGLSAVWIVGTAAGFVVLWKLGGGASERTVKSVQEQMLEGS